MAGRIYCDEYDRSVKHQLFTDRPETSGAFVLDKSSLAMPSWMPRVRLAAPHAGPRGDTLVVISLRGGADGVSMAVPHGDDAYYRLRPNLHVPRPDARGVAGRAIDLDGFFGFHPALSALEPIYRAGDLAIVHAAGGPDETRSHFSAQASMDRGAGSEYSGWLARHLMTLDTGNHSALRAVGIGNMLPPALLGKVNATVLASIKRHRLQVPAPVQDSFKATLEALYAREGGPLAEPTKQTLETLEILRQVEKAGYQPRGRAYPSRPFGESLRIVAQLIRADVGVEVACLGLWGWDTHAAQGTADGHLARQLELLGSGLAAFYEDVHHEIGHITVVVISEFGRRLAENASRGTDHGHGGAMLLLGGGIRGGRVYADWPGLEHEQLVGPGDLAVTTDYRDILGEILKRRLNSSDLDAIFPGHRVTARGVTKVI